MNQKAILRAVLIAVGLGVSLPLLADDGATSIAVGGLIPRRETRIVMAKEVLRIGVKKVVVDYDFRNDTEQDVTTEVAFPIPPYKNEAEEADPAVQSFKSFQLWVDGKPIQYNVEAKATVDDKDVSNILEADHIDIPSFGHYEEGGKDGAPDFERLPLSERQRLAKLGLCDNDSYFGNWTVHLQYHWTQTFPAHSTVHIRHEYAPVMGAADDMPVDALRLLLIPGSAQKDAKRWSDSGAQDVAGFCPEPGLLRGMIRRTSEVKNDLYDGTYFPLQWVDFILTTANTWQRPIEDFTLIVERPQSEEGGFRSDVSFCSPANGRVEKLDADHFQVHLTNFVPASELHIGYFMALQGKYVRPAAKNSAPASHRRVSLMIAGLIAGGVLLILAAFVVR